MHLSAYWPDPPATFYRPDLDFSVPGLLAEMDANGISAGLVLEEELAPNVEATLAEGEERVGRSGGRLLRSSTVDPTRGAGTVARAIERWERTNDLVAVKLYPGYLPFYPHDARLGPVYEFVARRKLLLLVHQGDTLDANGLLKYARPIEVDEVAVRYRDVTIVLCHFGNPWMEEAAEIVYKNENVYADTSGLLWSPRVPYYRQMFDRTQRRLAHALAAIGHADRVLFGSDWPLESLEIAVRLVDGLPIPEEDRVKILGGTARRLLARAGVRMPFAPSSPATASGPASGLRPP